MNNPIRKPACILAYNRFVGGIDTIDQQLHNYRVIRRTMKWCKKVAVRLIMQALLNSHRLYRMRDGNPKDDRLQNTKDEYEGLLEKRMDLMQSALQSATKRRRVEESENPEPSDEIKRTIVDLEKAVNQYKSQNHESKELIVQLQFKCASLEADLHKNSLNEKEQILTQQLSDKEKEISSLNEKLVNVEHTVSLKDNEMEMLTNSVSESKNMTEEMKEMITFLQNEISVMRDDAEQSIILSSVNDLNFSTPPKSETSFLVQKLDCISGGLMNLNKKAQCGLEKAQDSLPSRFSIAQFSFKDISEKDQIINETKFKLKELEEKLKTFTDDSEISQIKYGETESQKNKLEDELDKMKTEVRNLGQVKEQLEHQLQLKNQNITEQEMYLDSLLQDKSRLDNEVSELKDKNKEINENSIGKDIFQLLKSENETLTHDLKSTKSQLQLINESKENLENDIDCSNKTKNEILEKSNSLLEELEQLHRNLELTSKIQSENNDLVEELQTYKVQSDNLKKELIAKDNEIISLKNEQNKCQTQLEDQLNETSILKDQLRQLDETCQSMKMDLNNCSNKILAKQSVISDYKLKIKSLEGEFQIQKLEIDKLVSNLKEQQGKNTLLSHQKDEMLELLTKSSRKIETLENEQKIVKDELTSLRNNSSKTDDEFKALLESKEKLLGEINILGSKMKDIKIKVLDLLFSTDNKQSISCDSQSIDDIIYNVKRTVIQLSNRFVDYLEECKKRKDLEESVISMKKFLNNCEVELQAKDKHIKTLNDQLNNQSEQICQLDNVITDLKDKFTTEKSKSSNLNQALLAKNIEIEKLLPKLTDRVNEIEEPQKSSKVSESSDSNDYPSNATSSDQSLVWWHANKEGEKQSKSTQNKNSRSVRRKKNQSYALMDDCDENSHPAFELTTASTRKTRQKRKTCKTPGSNVLTPFNPHVATVDSNEDESKTKKRRRKLFRSDISEPFMCTPPLVSLS
ncbi:hypothetical protein GQR58_026734 [Nymphon striatum]|nr:hypothetical protein GQR58_026734 [Nymphon striatum]